MNETTTTIETMDKPTESQFHAGHYTLREHVGEAMDKYFGKLSGSIVRNLYEMVLAEIEVPLLEAVMQHTRSNQSKAAILLGISRGTLRKKLKIYGFID